MINISRVIAALLFLIFLFIAGIYVIKYEDKKYYKVISELEQVKIDIRKLEENLNITRGKLNVCETNLETCLGTLAMCRKNKEDYFKIVNNLISKKK